MLASDFPAETGAYQDDQIESVFATVRHRTVRTKGCLSHGTTLAMVFKLITTASKTWRRLMGNNQLPKIIEGVRFKDGMQIDETKTRAAARSRRHPKSAGVACTTPRPLAAHGHSGPWP